MSSMQEVFHLICYGAIHCKSEVNSTIHFFLNSEYNRLNKWWYAYEYEKSIAILLQFSSCDIPDNSEKVSKYKSQNIHL